MDNDMDPQQRKLVDELIKRVEALEVYFLHQRLIFKKENIEDSESKLKNEEQEINQLNQDLEDKIAEMKELKKDSDDKLEQQI